MRIRLKDSPSGPWSCWHRVTEHESLSKETVRRRPSEDELKPWCQTMWCLPKLDAEIVARLENLLDLSAEKSDAKRPVVNFEETPVQLIGETRVPIPPGKGMSRRVDYEYGRKWHCQPVRHGRSPRGTPQGQRH